MTDTTPTRPSRLYTATVVLSSLVIALPMLFGKLIEAAIDAANPAKVDVSQDLAYLRELLGFSFGFLGILLLIVIALIVQRYRKHRSFSAIALPVIVLVAQLVVGLLVLLMTGVVDGIEDAYSSTLA
jgi:hypothetical protein